MLATQVEGHFSHVLKEQLLEMLGGSVWDGGVDVLFLCGGGFTGSDEQPVIPARNGAKPRSATDSEQSFLCALTE